MKDFIEDLATRTISFYAAEIVVGLFLSYLFHYFSKLYSRHFIRLWALSWASYALSTVALIVLTATDVSSTGIFRHVVSFLSIVLQIYQVAFLLFGSYELIRHTRISRRNFLLLTIAIVLLGLCAVIPFSFSPEGAYNRYVLRLGTRYAIVFAGFCIAGYLTAISHRFAKGIGKSLMATSFFIYGCYHLYYLIIVVTNALSGQLKFPYLFGIVELVTICLTGLSMFIWLLEDERLSLARTNKLLDDFYYRVSHDLRAPIATMRGLVNIARLEVKDTDSLKYVLMLEERALKLDRTISYIEQIARNRQLKLKLEPVDFNILINEVHNRVRENDKAYLVNFEYKSNKRNVLISDYYLLKEILTKIVENAIEFRQENMKQPFVRIEFERKKECVVISVEDNGIGIQPESIPKVFDMFYKEDPNRKGGGLGLYSAVEMLEKLNGTISVRSVPGSGSTFTVTLPAV